MQRYGGAIEYILRLPLCIGADIINKCIESRNEHQLLEIYLQMFPYFKEAQTFEEYKRSCQTLKVDSTASEEDLLQRTLEMEHRIRSGQVTIISD